MIVKQCSQLIARIGVFWLLALLLIPFLHHPVAAAEPAGALDVARVDAFVREQVQRHGIPGLAVAVVERDRVIYQGGYGKADQAGRPVTPQTPFVLASASKPITAPAITPTRIPW